MISASDTLSLAPGVALSGKRLSDPVRGESWPLNASGAFVLERIGVPVGAIVRDLAETFSLTLEDARGDVLRFVWYLNRLALVNIERETSRLRQLADWVSLAARLAPAGAVPVAASRRRALDTDSVGRALVSTFAAVLPRVGVVAAIATALTAQLSLILGAGLAVPLLIGLGTGLGLGLHEATHAAFLRRVPSALVCRGRRTYVLHAPVSSRRRVAVAVGGPLTVSLLGIGLVLIGVSATAPVLSVAGWPLAAHAVALSVVGGDGRVACGL